MLLVTWCFNKNDSSQCKLFSIYIPKWLAASLVAYLGGLFIGVYILVHRSVSKLSGCPNCTSRAMTTDKNAMNDSIVVNILISSKENAVLMLPSNESTSLCFKISHSYYYSCCDLVNLKANNTCCKIWSTGCTKDSAALVLHPQVFFSHFYE